MNSKYKNISQLIAGRILGHPLSEEENRCLDDWLQLSKENRSLYERVRTGKLTLQMLRKEQQGYGKQMESRFSHRVFARKRRLYLWRWTGVAATVALLFAFFYYSYSGREEMPQIQPGKGGALLTLADGRQMDISGEMPETVDRLLTSATVNISADTVAWHTLTVDAGQEYMLRLPDSTQVWVNSQSELRFPTTFVNDRRTVQLKGEAFFAVTKDASRPFVVSVDKADIAVYGTRFNVSCYADEPLSAVLVEGSVGFRVSGGEEVRLQPSERLTYDPATKAVEVSRVDVAPYVAWVEHYFVFHGETLEEIMRTLSRWYDFTPVFTSDSVRDIRLSGRLYRYDDIRILLDSYEQTSDLKFTLQGKQIIISE